MYLPIYVIIVLNIHDRWQKDSFWQRKCTESLCAHQLKDTEWLFQKQKARGSRVARNFNSQIKKAMQDKYR